MGGREVVAPLVVVGGARPRVGASSPLLLALAGTHPLTNTILIKLRSAVEYT